MAKTLTAKFKCPARFPKKGSKPGKGSKAKRSAGPCWRIEKTTKGIKKGYATAFYDARTGKLIGFGQGYLTPGKTVKQVCGVTKDPRRAAVKNRAGASLDAELCVTFATPKLKSRPKAKSKRKGRKRKR